MKCEKIRIKYEIRLKQMSFFEIFQLPNANFSLRGGLHYIFIGKIGTIYGIWTTQNQSSLFIPRTDLHWVHIKNIFK